jgi:hypothetical protein
VLPPPLGHARADEANITGGGAIAGLIDITVLKVNIAV